MNSPYMGRFRVSQVQHSNHDGLDLVGIDGKEIHSTIQGRVLKAGWENPNNHNQGFGLYVKIQQTNTNKVFYFGHLSEVKVKTGDIVKVTQVIGIEGSTGHSTGSHCHYCCRLNGSKQGVQSISTISGIPNKLGTYDDGYRPKTQTPQIKSKSNTEIAKEVIAGKWGNGQDRKNRLTAAGYNYSAIQAEVSRLLRQ